VNNMFSIVKKEEATTKLGSEPSIETNWNSINKYVKPFNFQPPNF
jgi:hypothetical protein